MVEKLINTDRKINSPDKKVQNENNDLTSQNMELHFVRHKLEAFQANMLRDVQKRMSGMIDEVMQELRQQELQAHEFRNFAKTQNQQQSNTWSNRVHSTTTTTSEEPLEKTTVDGNSFHGDEEEDEQQNATDKTATQSLERRTSNVSSDSDHSKSNESTHSRKKRRLRTLPDKVFRSRESYLTALLEVDHMKTIYHIFYIIFIVFLLNNVTYDYFVNGSVNFGLGTFKASFAKIQYVLGIWLVQNTFVCSIYYALSGWSFVRSKLAKRETLQSLWSTSCLLLYITSQLIFTYLPTKICLVLDLPYVTACVLLLESVRMLMKMHGFVRTISARLLQGKLKSDNDTAESKGCLMPPFQKYFYYLFAPTLLYRDNYPRTAVICWKFALGRFLEVVAIAFLYSYIYERHIKVIFGNFGIEEITIGSIIIKLFGMLMPCIIIYLCGFYLILHSWLNFTAELLRFGDRMFYRDWWTASNYEAYYRNWNVVVHDWLYEYIYKDFYLYIFKGSKFASSLTVFTISALFHEYVLGYALQVFFPVMFVFFGIIGVLMIFLTRIAPKNLGNIMLWFSLIYGNCMMISLYSMEYFTRVNCPKDSYDSWSDILIPHLWSCYMK
ncbi:sterol O-acyltransferase 1 isoform X2 [Musca domestica]|uniref:O-acyltransferase n=1 Tax=Musca domestica TaxID=7370 RepID=A0A1I8MX72_MUSDO|nr:sterol O-acyltransferase 1 isoform X2 [Musca domestica]